jgi:hypothetical protein
MFTEKFNDYACEGDSISCEKDGFTIVARIERDDDLGPPWKECDGHGPVSDWRPKNSKRPGEKILSEDRGSCRFYDWQEAIKIAKRDGWDAPPYGEGTPGERAERAVQRDFDSLKAWCDDEWWRCVVTLSLSKDDIELDEYAASLGSVEVNHPNSEDGNAYLATVANEMLDEALSVGKAAVERMLKVLSE